MNELMKQLLALTAEQFEAVVAGARAARDIVGGPHRVGRPRGSRNKPKDEPPKPLFNSTADAERA